MLWPVSAVYQGLLALRRGLYRLGVFRTFSVAVPVIVVGNVIVGGVGKTPVVVALVHHLLARGLRPGVISRGYGRRSEGCVEVQANSTADDVGDEALLIQRRCGVPVVVANRRSQAAGLLLARHAEVDVLVSDDGLQHLALQRDLDICVFDERGIGNAWLLPAGPLREPWPRAVDLVLHTGEAAAFAGYTAHRELAAYALRRDGTRVPMSQLGARPLVAVAGIAQPQKFFAMLRADGLALTQTIALPDHYSFAGWSSPWTDGATLLCTEKDAAKLWTTHPDALAVPMNLALEPRFLAAVEALLPPALAAKLSSTPSH
jgi:tetraacyldisaccharide 4'-kinase